MYMISYKLVTQTHNSRIYGHIVNEYVNNTHDYYFLSNELAKLYNKVGGASNFTDSVRVCHSIKGKWSKDFEERITCCGTANLEVSNPKTGNVFWIGFNYGH